MGVRDTLFRMFRRAQHPKTGRLIDYSPQFDADEGDVPDKLDFVAVKALLKRADDGDAAAMLELNDTMEARDIHLKRVASTRRGSLTVMDWNIAMPSNVPEGISRELAGEAADYINGALEELPSFETLLQSMAMAIGPNLAVIEVVWDGPRIIGLEPIRYNRLVIDRQLGPDVRIITVKAPNGRVLPPFKFIVHVPDANAGGFVFTNTISRGQASIWVMKKLAQQDWATFSEIFGMPVRVAHHSKQATKADRDTALAALAAMGTRAYALLSDDIKFEMFEAQRGAEPYSGMIEYLQRQQSIGYVGQTLTTDTTGSGGLGGAGAAGVHEGIRRLITEEDAKAEERTLRETLFPWMLRFKFPRTWDLMPVPRFNRVFRDGITRLDKAELVRKASQEIGMPVGLDWARKELGIPAADEGEQIIPRIEPAMPAGAAGAIR